MSAQQLRCKQAILALELTTGQGARPGMIWRWSSPRQVDIRTDLDDLVEVDGGFASRYDPGPPVYTATVRGVASGLYVADMNSYFDDQAEITPRRLELPA